MSTDEKKFKELDLQDLEGANGGIISRPPTNSWRSTFAITETVERIEPEAVQVSVEEIDFEVVSPSEQVPDIRIFKAPQ